ncbi:MAG TPA: ABC transporter substrate-binding protein [Alphaproteobacteria bacterium]|nr:ABC transporter substrate-binding protein [Alphaproteobacteria bacterium]
MLRRLKTVLAALAIAVLLPLAASAGPDTPKEVIESYYAQLLKTMQNGSKLGYKGRYELLKPWVEKTFDVALMAQTSVGAYWDKMTADQREQLIDAFRNFTVANYAHNFHGYDGEKFVTTDAKETPRKDIIVYSAIVKADGDKVAIDYLLRADSDHNYKVIDVFLEGSISQLATRRSEYTSVIRERGVDALIAAIRKKADDLAS